MREYRQTQADFHSRNLSVDEGLNPILPEDGFASADYRLDAMASATAGVKYGIALTASADLRFRAEYLNQSFSTADYEKNSALVFRTSLKYRFQIEEFTSRASEYVQATNLHISDMI